MRLILSRHGNTFAPGEPAYWVGSKDDLPLVESGKAQARALAAALKEADLPLEAVFAAPLQRTLGYARLLADEGVLQPPKVDERLMELDYGLWSGLTNEQVAASFAQEPLDAWAQRSVWPAEGRWGESEAEVVERVRSFASQVSQEYPLGNVLAISSNGLMRYFLALVPGAWEKAAEDHAFKVATGNLSILEYCSGSWQVIHWNQKPQAAFFSRAHIS